MRLTNSYTSTLPVEIMEKLSFYSIQERLAKNKIIELALKNWFEQVERAAFIASFKRAKGDPEMLAMAEEGMEDVLKMLDNA